MVVCDLNVIDLSDFASRKADIARQLMHAGTEIGFFYVCAAGCWCLQALSKTETRCLIWGVFVPDLQPRHR